MNILSVAFIVFIVNLPFGYWRANEKKLSARWFLSIHAPVPLVIAIRMLSGLGWQFITFPIMIGAFFGGQFAGGKLHRLRSNRFGAQVSSCLVLDLLNNNQKN
ncbi:MAG TPA: hypothetical protein VFG02_10465 [Nitrospirota bacterium]|nr:hypothetical protein [Nitrospirota bacterium]